MNKTESIFDYIARDQSMAMKLDEWYGNGYTSLALRLENEMDRHREAGRVFLETGSDDAIYEGLALPR